MNDILFGNNNKTIIQKLASRCFQRNKLRNGIAVLAIFLTTLLICTVFSIGGSYVNSWKLQQEQTRGTNGHATLNAPSAQQYEYLSASEEIKDIGIRADVFLPSFVKADFDTNNSNLYYGFRFYNSSEWEKHRTPVLENINGSYPNGANEIMVPLWVLEKWNITNPYIGMELPFTYQNNSMIESQKTFRLSGWFDEYDYIGDGNIAYLLVSEAFCNEVNFDIWSNPETTADMRFSDTQNVLEVVSALENGMTFEYGQELSVNPDLLNSNSHLQAIVLCIVLSFFIALCGYLLIYNIFYISISNDIQFYGQLRTIGTTSIQIGKIISKQAIKLACLGIVAGLLTSFVLSHFIIPAVLRTLTETNSGITVVQQPIIYLGAAIFSLIMVFLSVRKPIQIAKKVSPVTALHYQSEIGKRKSQLKSRHFSAWRMALRNIQRTKKKSILAVLSIFLGITSCLIVTLLIQSMSTDNFVDYELEYDIELTNQTLALGYSGEQSQLFDEKLINELASIDGVSEISLQKEQTIMPAYSKDVFYPYIQNKYQSQGMEAPNANYYGQYPTRFYTQLVSIDADKIKDYITEQGLDYGGFCQGQYGLIACDYPELFPDNMTLHFQTGQLNQYEVIPNDKSMEIPIGGFLPSSYYGGLSSDAPYVFVSDAGMEKLAPEAYISSLGIDVTSSNEKMVLSDIRELCNQSGKISIISKAELIEGLHSAKITLYTLGGGIAFVLAFIGVFIFVNIMFTNIEARKHELYVMESIGMTKKQCRRMLQMEGLWYALISLALCLTFGNVLLFLVYQAFVGMVEYAVFSYPVWMLFIIIIVLTAFCWLIPSLFVNRMMIKSTIERLRQN